MVEFALILPLLLLLVFGIISFGVAYNTQIALQGAAREGARALALGNDPVAAARNAVGERLEDDITVSPGPGCPDVVDPESPENATVAITSDVNFLIPFFFIDPTFELEATAEMRCGL